MTLGSDGQIISDAATDTERIAVLEERIQRLEADFDTLLNKISPGKAFKDDLLG